MIRWGLPLLGAACVSTAVGCADPEVTPAPVTVTAAVAAPPPAPKEAAVAPKTLTRDAELAGNEHHVSVLEGKVVFKVHAIETPVLETRSTSKGLLYSSLDVKLSEEQTVHCVAYSSMLWPGGFVASDLRGEHDWANDGSEVPDAKAKTTSDLTRMDVSVVSGRPTLSGRATVKNEGGEIVADRKIILTSSPEFTFSCSDRTIGFDKRFNAFAGEAMNSLKVDLPVLKNPTKLATYRIQEEGKVVGFRQVETYLDWLNTTTTYTTESGVAMVKGQIIGLDQALTSETNARGEETTIKVQVILDGNREVENLLATRDLKGGWHVTGENMDGAVDARFSAKTAFMSEMSPEWNARVKSLGTGKGKKASLAKLTVFGMDGAVAVTAKRNEDGSIAMATDKAATAVSYDADGVTSIVTDKTKYERIRFVTRPKAAASKPAKLQAKKKK